MTTEPMGYGVRRMCVAFDLEHYSRRPDAGQIEAQRAMAGLLRGAGERGALERAQWLTQELGDGELALLPPGIDEARVITSLWRELREGCTGTTGTPARRPGSGCGLRCMRGKPTSPITGSPGTPSTPSAGYVTVPR